MTDARTLLERMVRAEWALSDTFEANGLVGHSEVQAVADKEWGDAVDAAVAFLGIERPQSLFAELDIPMSKENREIAEHNMRTMAGDLMVRGGFCHCPTCGQVAKQSRVKTGRAA
jgi:hypothetical protein